MNPRDYMVYQDEIEDNCFRFSNGNEISFSQIAYELTKRTSRLNIKVYGISYNGKLPPDVFLQADYGFVDWGAVPFKTYYVLEILNVEVL